MDSEENREDIDDEEWWENWDQRRRLAVVQVLCYVAYVIAIYIRNVYYDTQCNDDSETSLKGKKRKARAWEREFEGIREAIRDAARDIREGNAIIERARQHVYTEEEVFAELVKIGVEKNLRYSAYTFLVEDPARTRAFFGYPVDERKDFLLQMMYGAEDPL